MNDSQQPEPGDVDISPGASAGRSPRHRSHSRVSALGLVAAVVVALVAGPAVASRLASAGGGTGPNPNPGQVAEEPALPAPTTTPDNANQREGRTVSPTPAPTGENANQREGRTADPTPAPTGENANQREGRTATRSCP